LCWVNAGSTWYSPKLLNGKLYLQ